jgi:hypothetical protein
MIYNMDMITVCTNNSECQTNCCSSTACVSISVCRDKDRMVLILVVALFGLIAIIVVITLSIRFCKRREVGGLEQQNYINSIE